MEESRVGLNKVARVAQKAKKKVEQEGLGKILGEHFLKIINIFFKY